MRRIHFRLIAARGPVTEPSYAMGEEYDDAFSRIAAAVARKSGLVVLTANSANFSIDGNPVGKATLGRPSGAVVAEIEFIQVDS